MSQSLGQHPIDLQTKAPVWLEPASNELMGGTETIIESYNDIFRMGELFESERSTGATNFNDTSSRSHAMIWIRIYTMVDDDKMRINNFKIIDLAGSERISQ